MSKTFNFDKEKSEEIYKRILEDKYSNTPLNSPIAELLENVANQAVNFDLKNNISIEHLREFLEKVFWSSVLTEERNHHLISASLTPPNPLMDRGILENSNFHFKVRESFEPNILAKLSPALENTENHIGVWVGDDNKLEIWGFTTDSKIVAKAVEVGQILIYTKNDITQKSQQKVLVDNSRISFIKELDLPFNLGELQNNLVNLTIQMREHRHGGTLLVVDNEDWTASISEAYYFEHPVSMVGILDEKQSHPILDKTIAKIQKSNTNLLARLTAPDGATLIDKELNVIGFGAKTKPIDSNEKFEIIMTEPLEDDKEETMELWKYKAGTRHKSAARFVFDQKNNSFAIVASSEGKISIMSWDRKTNKVRIIQHAEYMFL